MSSRTCPGCGGSLAPGQDVCPRCAPIDPTRTSDATLDRPSSYADSFEARFAPGTVIHDRYRIIGLIGRGGMGEVYRADDLKLARPVALKFLPESVEGDPRRLSRLLNEVNVALRVSHPNVCRVHDIGETEGQHYISMEYVDGEDLASLLRRVGHFPEERAVKLARQLCAGLAAAHEQGVLHRDLKPANVMIDGRGNVKITDFGLAGLAEDLADERAVAGTPAYMAPEQLTGKRVSLRSDLYSLGLVLFELFAGQPAFGDRRRDTPPTSLSSLVEIDPAVERAVQRCLEEDPTLRPRSALAIAAALPGGDPLAAALAAGETPSPQLVAEAGSTEGFSPPWAMGLATFALLALVLYIFFLPPTTVVMNAPLELAPAVLEAKAAEILATLGYDEPPADRSSGFRLDRSVYNGVRWRNPDTPRAELVGRVQPTVLPFVYRQSPRVIAPSNAATVASWTSDPQTVFPGMVDVALDARGRLLWLLAVPSEEAGVSDEAPAALPVDWSLLFDAAGFDPGEFVEVEPRWPHRVHADRRAAWEGRLPEAPEIPIRVEAASYLGRPVAFRIVTSDTNVDSGRASQPTTFERLTDIARPALNLTVLVIGGLLAWRNVRAGRGDHRTALRFAFYVMFVRMLWLLVAEHFPTRLEEAVLRGHLAYACYRFCLVYVFYLAVEPFARKLWPRVLVGWVRVFQGRFGDPLVGRDVLVGVVFGLTIRGIQLAADRFDAFVQGVPLQLDYGPWSVETLRGLRHALGGIAVIHTEDSVYFFQLITLAVVLQLLTRRRWAMICLMVVVVYLLEVGTANPLRALPSFVPIFAAHIIVLFRFGALPLLIGVTVNSLAQDLPLTASLNAWYATPSWLFLTLVIGLTVWGLRVSLAATPLRSQNRA